MNRYCVEYSAEEIKEIKRVNFDNVPSEDIAITKLIDMKRKIHIFDNISDESVKILIKNVFFQRFQSQETIIYENDDSKEIFILISGICRVFVENSIVGTLRAGQSFGEISAIFSKKRNASVVCISEEATVLKFILKENILDLDANAAANLYKNISEQINKKLELQNKIFSKEH